jgi:hypothetical protein
MSEVKERVEYLGILGVQFQVKLLGELLVPNNINKETTNKFFEEVIEMLHPKYFQTMDMRRIMTIIKEYYQKYKVGPNIDNVIEMINSLSTTDIEKDELRARINSIRGVWKGYKENTIKNDRDHTKSRTVDFVKQQELAIINAEVAEKFKFGIVDSATLYGFSEKYKGVINIGSPMKSGTDILERPEELLVDDYRVPIGTGNKYLDDHIDGGLSIGDYALVLAAQGVGKSSFLTFVANNGYLNGKNVAHIIMEGRKDDIRRKHYSKMFKVPSTELSMKKEDILIQVSKLRTNLKVGNLVIERLKSGTTPNQLKSWIKKEEDDRGFKFDMICLDYIDCMSSNVYNANKYFGQEEVINDVENMCEEEGWRMWIGIQATKLANNKRIVLMEDCGGATERIKKAPLVITLGRDQEQKTNGRVNISIPKCRWSKDGYLFEDILFDGDMLKMEFNTGNNIQSLDTNKVILEVPKEEVKVDKIISIVNSLPATNLSKLSNIEL